MGETVERYQWITQRAWQFAIAYGIGQRTSHVPLDGPFELNQRFLVGVNDELLTTDDAAHGTLRFLFHSMTFPKCL
jgi:hypothetical protein